MKNIAATLSITASLVLLSACLDKETGLAGSLQGPGGSGSENSAPTITGNPPAAVTIGATYTFTPLASDPDGDALTFSIENRPAWASFDSNTGTVSGDPTLGDIGNYGDISVTVSDGELSASMNRFSVDVLQNATASTTLSWSAPTINDDGSPLTNLAGYKIYYGVSPRSYSNEISIDNPSITTYVVENLAPDTYYFAATSVNSDGMESSFSAEAVRTVN